jgi:hypothetical protein
VSVVKEPAQRLARDLGHTVATVGSGIEVLADFDPIVIVVVAECVVAARVDDPLDAGAPRRLEHAVRSALARRTR